MVRSNGLRFVGVAAACAALTLTMAACGSSSGTTNPPGAGGENQKVSVGVLPIADYATAYWAQSKGLFSKEHLDVTLTPLQGGPIGIQQVSSGQIQFASANLISFSVAAEHGAQITNVALTSALGKDAGAVVVKPDSPIKSLTDLGGATVGINTVNNVGDVTINNLIKSQGSSAKPKYVEVPFNEMIAGVQSGSIAAGYVTEPFATAAKQAGLRPIANLYVGPNADLAMATYITSKAYAKSNGTTVTAFQHAMNAASADIIAHEADFRTFLPSVIKITPDVAQAMALPQFQDQLDVTKLQHTADILLDQGVLSKKLPMSDYAAK